MDGRILVHVLSLPFVTIGVPCLDEERHVEEFLRGALAQDYPPDRVEVIVADGGSTDRTREIIAKVATADPRVSMVENPGRVQAAGMNEIIRRARGDVIVRMDVHARYAGDYVRNSVAVLQRTGASNVGGAARPLGDAYFQRAVCAALESPLGVGGSKYRCADNEGFVESVWNGAFPREVFERVGLYDPRAVTNEDAELNQRIRDAGGSVYLSRDVVVQYFPRDSPIKIAMQYFGYGRGRARTTLKHGRLPSIRPVLPFLLVICGAALLATSSLHPLTPVALLCYASLTGLEAIRAGARRGLALVPAVWMIFPLMHVAHGMGFATGLAHYLRRPDWSEAEKLPSRSEEYASVG